jgi:hypothetical protein
MREPQVPRSNHHVILWSAAAPADGAVPRTGGASLSACRDAAGSALWRPLTPAASIRRPKASKFCPYYRFCVALSVAIASSGVPGHRARPNIVGDCHIGAARQSDPVPPCERRSLSVTAIECSQLWPTANCPFSAEKWTPLRIMAGVSSDAALTDRTVFRNRAYCLISLAEMGCMQPVMVRDSASGNRA